jgi:hypothetical protein
MNRADAAIAAEILDWATENFYYVPADRAVKVARRILVDASSVVHQEAADILRSGGGDWRPVFGDFIRRSSPGMRRTAAQEAAHDKAMDSINAALAEGVVNDFDRGNRRREAVMATKRKCSI